MDLKLYLALAGGLGLAYASYTYLNKPRPVSIIPKDLTKRISQQVKHQMMIVCITYSKAMKKIREENADKIKGKQDEVFSQFRNELSQVYVAKQNLILKKYVVSRQSYGKSLQKWKHEKQILKNTEQIITMMQRALTGLTPDFTVPQQVYAAFNREQLCAIYKEMVALIGKKVTHKLQQCLTHDPNFNPNSDDDFRNAIRQLQIYDVKVEFLKQKGFKTEWGCPNEIFFKYLEHEKTKDEAYEKKVIAYEKTYEKIIEIVSHDPKAMTDAKIEEMFEKALVEPLPPKTVVQPIPQAVQPRQVPVEAPKVQKAQSFVAPARKPVDEEAELQALMMQQLMSRSQQPMRTTSTTSQQQLPKLGMTSSQIQNDWQKHGSIHEHPVSKMQEATEEIAIGQKDDKLIKKEQQIVEEVIREKELEEEESKIEVEQSQEVATSQIAPVEVIPEQPVEQSSAPVEQQVEVPVVAQIKVEEVAVVVQQPGTEPVVVVEEQKVEVVLQEQKPIQEQQQQQEQVEEQKPQEEQQ